MTRELYARHIIKPRDANPRLGNNDLEASTVLSCCCILNTSESCIKSTVCGLLLKRDRCATPATSTTPRVQAACP